MGAVCEAGATEAAAGARVSVMMMLGTLIKTGPYVRRVAAEGTFSARWHRVRPGIDRGGTERGQRNQDNQTSEQHRTHRHRIFDHALVFNSAGHEGRARYPIRVPVARGDILLQWGRKAPARST